MGTGQAAADVPGPVSRSLVLRLVLTGTDPLSGSVGLEQPPAAGIDFSGWIGLMSAINELCAGQPGTSMN